MKAKLSILIIAAVAMVSFTLGSCSDDKLGASIFDTVDHPLDKSLYTFPLDTFVKVNFQEPYNVRYMYKMQDMSLSSSDLQKNLTPCSYDKSVDLATLAKYLWFDIYKELANQHEIFLKKYSPRIIHIIGSKSLNVSQGTETLGVAEGGLKISLYNANNLSVDDIDMMNEYFFKTMHHEFGHILDQTISRPLLFNLLSNGQYDASGWTNTPDSVAAGRGFVSPYASSMAREDWVEVLANYVTRDTLSWNILLGSAEYEWEEIDIESESAYRKLITPGCNLDTIGYYKADKSGNGDNKVYRRVCVRNAAGNVEKDENGNPIWVHKSGIDGRSLILTKLDMVRAWLSNNYGISIDAMRKMVQQRTYLTDSKGDFVIKNGKLVNRFSYNNYELMNSLRNQVEKYKELQPKN
jgi:substrate import-associated zinc metallohydrolase lipoprotein